MSTLVCTLQGRFGNQTLQWLFAYAYAQQHGMTFECEPWIGEKIFTLPAYGRPSRRDYHRVSDKTIFLPHTGFIEYRGYAQCQSAMIYTKRQAQAWLPLQPVIAQACEAARQADGGHDDRLVCHLRRGDYTGYGYPIVSLASYRTAAEHYGFDWSSPRIAFLSEEDPTPHQGFLPDDLAFLPDFYRMLTAPTLFRANSSFSWLAGLLGNGLVLSPVVAGLAGGKEHLCPFVPGNWPKFTSGLDFITDLHVAP